MGYILNSIRLTHEELLLTRGDVFKPAKLLLKLKRLAPQLEQLPDDYRYGIGVSHYFFMDDPTFYLPAEILDGFQALGFDISFDQLGLDHGAGN